MKIPAVIAIVMVGVFGFAGAQEGDIPRPQGPYLGQTPPNTTPVLFAADLLSPRCAIHGCPVFSPGGEEVFWGPMSGSKCGEKNDEILFRKQVDGVWSEPRVVPFSSAFWDSDDPCLSPDGKRIYFTTHRPSGLLRFDFDEKIMYAEREGTGWSSARSVGRAVNAMFRHWQVSVNRNYDLFFHAERETDKPGIFVARWVRGAYQKPERLPDEINSVNSTNPFVAPDESYLLFVRTMPETGDDIFVSFKDANGKWTEARKLGDAVNSASHDMCPNVSPDGKFLFFLRLREGMNRAFWVSASVIEELRIGSSGGSTAGGPCGR